MPKQSRILPGTGASLLNITVGDQIFFIRYKKYRKTTEERARKKIFIIPLLVNQMKQKPSSPVSNNH